MILGSIYLGKDLWIWYSPLLVMVRGFNKKPCYPLACFNFMNFLVNRGSFDGASWAYSICLKIMSDLLKHTLLLCSVTCHGIVQRPVYVALDALILIITPNLWPSYGYEENKVEKWKVFVYWGSNYQLCFVVYHCMVVVWKISTGAGCGGCQQPVEATHSLQSGLLVCCFVIIHSWLSSGGSLATA